MWILIRFILFTAVKADIKLPFDTMLFPFAKILNICNPYKFSYRFFGPKTFREGKNKLHSVEEYTPPPNGFTLVSLGREKHVYAWHEHCLIPNTWISILQVLPVWGIGSQVGNADVGTRRPRLACVRGAYLFDYTIVQMNANPIESLFPFISVVWFVGLRTLMICFFVFRLWIVLICVELFVRGVESSN